MGPTRPIPPGTPHSPTRPLSLHWRLLESWFQRKYQIEPVTPDPGCLLAVNRYRHAGAPVTLQDGVEIRKGDPLLEVHFRRQALLPLIQDGDPLRMGVELIKLADRDLPRLARRLLEDPAFSDIKALHALTLFHRGIARYGFESHPVENPLAAWWFTYYHRLLMARDHAHGPHHIREFKERLVTRHAWVSVPNLHARLVALESRRRLPTQGTQSEQTEPHSSDP